MKLLQANPASHPQSALALAGILHRMKRDDEARVQVLRTVALLCTTPNPSEIEGRARSLAKELGDEKLVDKPIEPALLKELGFIELKSGIQVPPREVGLEEPIHFFFQPAKGSVKTVSVRVVKQTTGTGEPGYEFAYVEWCDRCRSWGSCGKTHGFSLQEGILAGCTTLEPVGGKERFRLVTRLTGK
jgi:hypothetical protein